eukprot:comp17667_c0_seq1/m.17468 comp17667_c0_seq1/g.17468  ORF comp17667_c0_seq1/g.17468 comp17667_c0_seq1/m.17468 type:complete len:476 (-) comp17667_c0_seq1:791-2218(-)
MAYYDQLVSRCPFRIEHSNEKGNHVVAARDLRAGELVLDNLPYASILQHCNSDDKCHRCFQKPKSGEILQRCSACRYVRYCGKACQAADWKEIHKLECPGVQSVSSTSIPDVALDELRLLHRSLLVRAMDLHSSPYTDSPLSRCTWAEVEAMPSHEQELEQTDPHRYKGNLMLAHMAVDMAKRGLKGKMAQYAPTLDLACGLLCRMQCNNFSIWNDLLVGVGAGVYPAGALLNHACNGNCVITYDLKSKRQMFRTLHDVKCGEELTHSYIDPLIPVAERRENLRKMYFFDCHCTACEAADAPGSNEHFYYADTEGNPAKATAELTQARQLHDEGRNMANPPENCLPMLQMSYEIRKKALHPLNLDLLSSVCGLMNCCLELNMVAGALQCARKAVEVYSELYQKNHPMIGLQSYTQGDLCIESAQEVEATDPQLAKRLRQEAVECYRRSRSILSITHGPDNMLVFGLTASLDEHQQ